MNIALVLQHKLVVGIQRFLQGGSSPVQAASARMVRNHVRPSVAYAPCVAYSPSVAFGPGTPCATRLAVPHTTAGAAGRGHGISKAMPLRVLRVVESGMPRSSTGRLVISGRMADVCAELDRLVEREAALH